MRTTNQARIHQCVQAAAEAMEERQPFTLTTHQVARATGLDVRAVQQVGYRWSVRGVPIGDHVVMYNRSTFNAALRADGGPFPLRPIPGGTKNRSNPIHLSLCEALGLRADYGSLRAVAQHLGLALQNYSRALSRSSTEAGPGLIRAALAAGLRVILEPGRARFERIS